MTTKTRAGSFRAVILEPADRKTKTPWGFVLLPKDASGVLPRRGRITVNATVNGRSFQVTLEPDGKRSHWLRVDSGLLRAASIGIGDEVEVQIEPLAMEPKPKLPADFAKALGKNPRAKAVWNAATTIAQVDWIHWIESAKQAKTRQVRIEKACEMLESGKGRVCCFDTSGFYSKALSAPEELR